jgi:hypothetical protein
MGLKENYYNYYYLLLIKEKTHIYIKFLFKVRNVWSQNFKNYFLQFFDLLFSVRKIQKLLFA